VKERAETADNAKYQYLLVGFFCVGFRFAQPNTRVQLFYW